MRSRLLATSLALFLLAACSGGMSMEDYFTQLAERNADLDARGSAAQTDAQQQFAEASSQEAAAGIMADFLTELAGIGESAVESLEELDPPDGAKTEHEAYLAATRALSESFQAMLADIQTADPADVGTVIQTAGVEIDEKSNAVDVACMDLQAVADDNNVEADLRCTDPAEAQDKAAQSSLRNSVAAALVIFTDTDDFSGVTAEKMAEVEPSLTYVESPEPSTGPDVVSIWTNGTDRYAAAALSESGTCFLINRPAEGGGMFGTGTADDCTGDAASKGAEGSEW